MCRQVVKNIPNLPGFRKVNIGEIAHVGREVHSRWAGGDFDLSPRRIRHPLVGMPHICWRHGLSWFSANRRRTVSWEMPARSVSRTSSSANSARVQRAVAGRRSRTGSGHHRSLPDSFRLAPVSRLFAEWRLQVAEHKAALGSIDGRAPHPPR